MIPKKHAGGLPDPGRRRFVTGLAGGGVLAALGPWSGSGAEPAGLAGPAALSGTDFDLLIGQRVANFTGRRRLATVVNGSLPAPLLRWREGDTVTIRVRNELAEATSIHWHGILLPANMDGVPGLSFPGIGAGESFTYRFTVRQHGTYWYHSHSGIQEQRGLYGGLVIEPRESEPVPPDRDYVIVLSDWTDEDPHQVLARLKKQAHYYNFNQPTVGDFVRDLRREGWSATLADRLAWGRMRMNPTDLADVTGATYTFLVNGRTPAGNWTGLFRPGERVRLRFINAGAMTYFDVRIPGLQMTVVAADGQPVQPVAVEEFRIANAETYDVIVTPAAGQAYTIFAQAMDRSGFARGTLAPREGMAGPVPVLDRRVRLGMGDMGHGGHGGHGVHGDHRDHSAPATRTPEPAGHDHSQHGGHGDHQGHRADAGAPVDPGAPIPVLPAGLTHAPAESGPGVDMRTDAPSPRLDDPGIGLRDNGRRVLTYADLASSFPDPDGRKPGRVVELHLTGHMGRYLWSFNGEKASMAGPIPLRYGERVRFVLVNDTMMEHPIHLHGLWSDLEDEQGRFQVRKHTISVPPGHVRSFRVSADAPGRWALHCHLLMHMETGMFRVVLVDEDPPPGGAGQTGPHYGGGHS